MARSKTLTRGEDITHAILVLRGQRVILDRDLAAIYGVTTKRVNEQVKRNAERFSEDFMFQLTPEEAELSRSQFGDGLRISVEGMTVAFDCRSQTNEGCCPEQEGCRDRQSNATLLLWTTAFIRLRPT